MRRFRHFRPLRAALGAVTALSAVVLAPGLAVPAVSQQPPAARAQGATAPNTLFAGHALVAETVDSSLQNGWYTLGVHPGGVELDEALPVPGAHGATSSNIGSWYRRDPNGRFEPLHDRTELRLRRNGDLVLLTGRGRRLWHTGTHGSGAVRLTLHTNGSLALHTNTGRVVWSSRSGQVQMAGGMTLKPGRQLRGAWETALPHGEVVTLTMQRNGNLVHRCGRRIDWQSHTHVRGSSLRLETNGALRIVGPKGRTVWSAHIRGGRHDYAYLVGPWMEINADDNGTILWHVRTSCGT
jgi:hypothetical protein